MKIRNLFCLPLSALLLSGLFVAGLSLDKTVKTDAIGNYSTNASTYYNGITATSGTELAAQLHDLITDTHRYYTSYDDNGSNLYQQKTDQYYEDGKKVSGYLYEFYSGVKWPNAWKATAGNTSGGYNREHCWCQSLSNGLWGESGGGADMHHLRPVEVRLNSTRGNNKYGEVSGNRDSYKKYAQLGSQSTYALGGYYNSGVFEPIDSKKGDVARIILYTYLHYNSYRVSSLFGSYGTTNGNGSSSYFASSLLPLRNVVSASTEAKAVELLLDWNASDPVDDIERRRNEQVAVYQGNRNPFIDNSAYADAIWGSSTGITSISKSSIEMTTSDTTTISAISSTGGNITWTTSSSSVCSISSSTASSGSNITLTAQGAGTATITAKIIISGVTYSKTCEVTVSAPKTLSSIAVTDAKTSYKVGDSFIRPTVTATYTDESIKEVTNSATFSGYDLSTTGSQTVSVSYTENGGTKTVSYSITVSEATGDVYYQKCTSMSDIENGGKYVIVGYKESTTQYYAMPSYTSGNNIPGAAVTLTENDTRLTAANMSTAAVYTLVSTGTSNQYYIGDGTNYLYAAGSGTSNWLKAKAQTDSSVGAFTISYSTFFSVVAASSNRNTMRFNAGNNPPIFSCYGSNDSQTEVMFFKETSAGPVTPTLTSITLDTTNVQTSFVVNEEFNYDGLIVVGHFSDGSTEDLDSFNVSSPDMSTTGQKTITVSQGGQEATYTITVNASRTLSSITISGQKTNYVVNDVFSFNGTCTAHYSDSTSAIVTPTSVTSPDMTSAGQKTITVSYTEGSITESAQYTITVLEGGSSVPGSYTWDLSIASYNTPTSAEQVTWDSDCASMESIRTDSTKTAANNYLGGDSNSRTSSRFYTGNTLRFTPNTNYEITSVVYTATSTTYANALASETSTWTNASVSISSTTVTITPTDGTTAFNAVIGGTSGSTSVVVNYLYTPPAELSSITLDTTNAQTVFAVNDTFNYTGLVVTAHYSDSTSATVTPSSVSSPNMSTTGQKTVTVTYEENDVTKSATYNITVSATPTLGWDAPTINVFAGTQLTVAEANTWEVAYNNGTGTITYPTYGQFSVKLGGSTISLPYTWQPGDDGKSLAVSYNSLTTSSAIVSIVQTLNAINKEVPSEYATSNLTFTAACGGSGTANDGKGWTVASDAESGESSYDSTKGVHYGTGTSGTGNVTYITLTSNSFTAGTITRIVVNASTASGVTATVGVTVGGNQFGGNPQSLSSTATDYTFNGEAVSGQIVVTITKPSKVAKALYCKSVVVTYSTSSEIVNIANVAGHEDAQRAVVKFAKSFNAAMDTTSGCTTNMSSAWSTASSAWTTFLSEAAALGETEEAYAKSLIANASAVWTPGTDSNYMYCLERALATYDKCVSTHGMTAFMDEVRPSSRYSHVSPLKLSSSQMSSLFIITIIAGVTALSVGGYFFLRRKKEK